MKTVCHAKKNYGPKRYNFYGSQILPNFCPRGLNNKDKLYNFFAVKDQKKVFFHFFFAFLFMNELMHELEKC